MRWHVVVVLSVSLLGCRADQEREAAKCKLEAQKTYPNVTNSYMSVPAGEFIELCMRAAGYDFNNDNPNCTYSGIVVSEKPNPSVLWRKRRKRIARCGATYERGG
jgi:hypothetical protein